MNEKTCSILRGNILYSKYRGASILLLIVSLIFTSTVVAAEVISFEKAVESGLKNNYELQQKLEAVKSIERERNLLEAGVDWYIGIDGNYLYNSERIDDYQIIEKGNRFELALEGGKMTLSGLSLSSQLILADDNPFGFDNIEDKYKFRLDLSKRLYPIIPTETEKGFIQTDNSLIIAEANLFLARKNKKLDWLETYFNILRLKERKEYSKLSYQLVREELERVEAQFEIAEHGQEQLMMAEINLKEAELQEKQLESSFIQTVNSLSKELGIERGIILDKDSNYLKRFIQRVNSFNIELNNDEIENNLKKSNLQLRQILFDKDYAENELKWQMKEDNVALSTFGNYNYDAELADAYKDYWEAGLGISYDFYDGGRQRLTIEGIKAKINNLDEEYNYTLEQLNQQLKVMYDKYKIDKMDLEAKEIALEKAILEKKLFIEQYKKGLISEAQYEQKAITVSLAEVDYKESRDQLIFDKARIALFLELY